MAGNLRQLLPLVAKEPGGPRKSRISITAWFKSLSKQAAKTRPGVFRRFPIKRKHRLPFNDGPAQVSCISLAQALERAYSVSAGSFMRATVWIVLSNIDSLCSFSTVKKTNLYVPSLETINAPMLTMALVKQMLSRPLVTIVPDGSSHARSCA